MRITIYKYQLKLIGFQSVESEEDNFRYDEDNDSVASQQESDRIRSLPLRSEAAIQSTILKKPMLSDPFHVFDPYSEGNELKNEILSKPGKH